MAQTEAYPRMTVAQAIEELKMFPPDAEVRELVVDFIKTTDLKPVEPVRLFGPGGIMEKTYRGVGLRSVDAI